PPPAPWLAPPGACQSCGPQCILTGVPHTQELHMPQITVRSTSTRLAPQERERLTHELVGLMVDVLARKPESVLVGFESLDPQAWFAGGQALPAGASLVQAHITVVEGTGDAQA